MSLKIKTIFFAHKMDDEDEIKRHGKWHTHSQSEFEIHYYVQGYGIFNNADSQHILKPGRLFFSRPLEKHQISRTRKDIPLTFYSVLFDAQDPDPALHHRLQHDLIHPGYFDIGLNFRFFFEELREKLQSKVSNLRLAGEYQFLSFLFELGSRNLSNDHGPGHRYIEQSLRFMQENLFQPISVRDICRSLKLSEAHFIREFKKRTETTPKQYLLKLKVEAAAYALRTSETPIHKIASQFHFSNEFHFSKTFKNLKGLSPSAYRNWKRV